MTFNNGYKEHLIKKRDECVLNILEFYKDILYNRLKIRSTEYMRELDDKMLQKIGHEFNEFVKEIE